MSQFQIHCYRLLVSVSNSLLPPTSRKQWYFCEDRRSTKLMLIINIEPRIHAHLEGNQNPSNVSQSHIKDTRHKKQETYRHGQPTIHGQPPSYLRGPPHPTNCKENLINPNPNLHHFLVPPNHSLLFTTKEPSHTTIHMLNLLGKKLSVKYLEEGPNLGFDHAFEKRCSLKLVLNIMLHNLFPKTYGNFLCSFGMDLNLENLKPCLRAKSGWNLYLVSCWLACWWHDNGVGPPNSNTPNTQLTPSSLRV